MYDTKLSQKQMQLLDKYLMLNYSKDDIMDRMLFNKQAEQYPVVYEDIERYIKNYKGLKIKVPCRTRIEDLDDSSINSSYIRHDTIPTIIKAIEIAKRVNKEVEDIVW